MAALESFPVATRDWTFSLHVFLYLQVLDVATTWLGLRMGLGEASPFIRALMHWGPLAGVLASKAVALRVASAVSGDSSD